MKVTKLACDQINIPLIEEATSYYGGSVIVDPLPISSCTLYIHNSIIDIIV